MVERAQIAAELEGMNEHMIQEVIDFIRFLKGRRAIVSDEALLSESALRRDWLRPEEDEAWSTL